MGAPWRPPQQVSPAPAFVYRDPRTLSATRAHLPPAHTTVAVGTDDLSSAAARPGSPRRSQARAPGAPGGTGGVSPGGLCPCRALASARSRPGPGPRPHGAVGARSLR